MADSSQTFRGLRISGESWNHLNGPRVEGTVKINNVPFGFSSLPLESAILYLNCWCGRRLGSFPDCSASDGKWKTARLNSHPWNRRPACSQVACQAEWFTLLHFLIFFAAESGWMFGLKLLRSSVFMVMALCSCLTLRQDQLVCLGQSSRQKTLLGLRTEIPLTRGARHWIWTLLLAKQLLYHWTVTSLWNDVNPGSFEDRQLPHQPFSHVMRGSPWQESVGGWKCSCKPHREALPLSPCVPGQCALTFPGMTVSPNAAHYMWTLPLKNQVM